MFCRISVGHIFLLFCFFITFSKIQSDEILGCGGFIKSYVPIDFSKIEVKLYTKQGVLKDRTNCAPNNGYYFLPLYDKGEYLLKIEPPTGWSFKPTSVLVDIGGSFDPCTAGKDINFEFEGFGITGQVTNINNSFGPSGVVIHLLRDGELRTTVTSEDGNFYFTPVYPGQYTVKASHSKWKFEKDQISIQVSSGHTELPKNSLTVSGYDVSSYVKFKNHPIKGIYFFIFSENNNVIASDCLTGDVPGYMPLKKPLCYAVSDNKGQFSFPSLSPAHYKIVPFYKRNNMEYNFQPEEMAIHVLNDSVFLEQGFQVHSFNIEGKVLSSPNGKSVNDVKIFVNGTFATSCNADGKFVLNKLVTATHEITAQASKLHFNSIKVSLGPNFSNNLVITATSFEVCGFVNSEKSHIVTMTTMENGQEKIYRSNSEEVSGKFCEFLPPGKYSVNVHISNEDIKNGIQFFPGSQNIEIVSEPIYNINFLQLKAQVTGSVKCIRPLDCQHITVTMTYVSQDSTVESKKYITTLEDGNYVFNDVMPGYYYITLDDYKGCWEFKNQTINIDSKVNNAKTFEQTGYILKFISTHATDVTYNSLKPGDSSEKTLKIHQGSNNFCLEYPGLYTFHLKSCHLYEKDVIEYDVDSEISEILLTAMKHLTTVEIQSELQLNNLNVSITVNNETEIIKPKIPVLIDNMYHYSIDVYLQESEIALVTPISDVLWIVPTAYTLVGTRDCINYGPQIIGLVGKVIKGQVLPPLEDVKITVTVDDEVFLETRTVKDGMYQFPTLDRSKIYIVTASKDSYSFIGPDVKGVFKAHKLAEIIVEVVDKNNSQPLQGVLISLSGSDSYRSNLQTNTNGIISFNSLSPSDYYLKPMMKEYNFEPSSKIIQVKEGTTVNVKMQGLRVAYSAYGIVSSLNNEPVEKITVSATGTGSCSQYNEETTSEDNGQFRIRGLNPLCSYDVNIKENLNQKFERVIPGSVAIQVQKEDVHGLKLTVLEQVTHMDVVVHLWTSKPENFRNLVLKLCNELNPNTPVYNIKIDSALYKSVSSMNSDVLLHLPALPFDSKTYYIELDSSSSPSVHNYKTDIKYFIANTTFKYIKIIYEPNLLNPDQDIAQMSILVLPVILLIILFVYHIQQISKFLAGYLQNWNFAQITMPFTKNNAQYNERYDDEEIDQLVQSLSAPKRKVKPKKI